MAVIRCAAHQPNGRTRSYVFTAEPVGYPDTALVCGLKQCKTAGLAWLEAHEHDAYNRGERIFEAFTATMKMRVK